MKQLQILMLVLGVWIIASPWILGFAGLELARWSNVFAGAAVFILTLWVWLYEWNK